MSLHLCLPISIVKTKPNLLSVARYFCSSANSHCKLYKPPIIILIYILSHVTEFQWASSTNNQKLNTAETYYTRNWDIWMATLIYVLLAVPVRALSRHAFASSSAVTFDEMAFESITHGRKLLIFRWNNAYN